MATTIRIADDAHLNKADDDANGVGDGIQNMRDFTRTATNSSAIDREGIVNMRAVARTFSRSSLKDKRGVKGDEKDVEAEDDDPGLRQSGDFKSKQVRPRIVVPAPALFGHHPHPG